MRAFGFSVFVCLVMVIAGCPTQDEPTETQDTAIVGGWVEPDMEYSVAILENGDDICTGTLVDTRLVVTAGHCVYGIYGTMEVFFGINANNQATGTTVAVDSYQPHPSFNYYSLANDIGVIELAEDAPVAPVSMLADGIFDNGWIGTPLRFVGYGTTTWYSPQSGIRRAVDIDVGSVASSDFTYYDNNHQTCYGDSGGGAFADYDGQWQLIGVTSYGDYYCNTYGVDTRVDAYLTWIEGFMGSQPPPTGDELTVATEESFTLALDETVTFYFDTQSGYQYDVLLNTTSGDADLYTHPSDSIDINTYTCRPYYEGTVVEDCTITGAGSGEYWVMVHGYEASDVELIVVESPASCHAGNIGQQRYCRNNCPCGYALGSCRHDGQCADGLTCYEDSGDEYGLPWQVDVCAWP